MRAKNNIQLYSTLAMLALLTVAVIAAANSPAVLLAMQIALIAILVLVAVAVLFGCVYGIHWFQSKIQRLHIETDTAAAQTVAIHNGGDGTAYAVNPRGLPIQPLHLAAPDADRWSIWTTRRAGRGDKIIELPMAESPLALPAPQIPQIVRLEDIFDPAEATIRRLVLGAGAGGEIVTGHLRDLSHIAIAGTSRWGKSTFLQSLLYQLFLAREPVEFYLSDIGGQAFISFGIPYADSIIQSERMIDHIYGIYSERRAKFQRAGGQAGMGIRTLDIYNALTSEGLPYIVVAMDEVTALMANSKPMAHQLTELILQAGKYGIWLLLSGQNWKAKNVDTTIRDQFSSRFQLKAMDWRQAGILIPDSGAEEFDVKGRAAIVLPGAARVQTIQTPLIDEATIATVAGRPKRAIDMEWMVAPDEDDTGADEPTTREQKILEMSDDGYSLNQISRAINNDKVGGKYNLKIKAVIEKFRGDESGREP
jgi:DNA segregation ATPase FtsK/SpoIIIE-like protein